MRRMPSSATSVATRADDHAGAIIIDDCNRDCISSPSPAFTVIASETTTSSSNASLESLTAVHHPGHQREHPTTTATSLRPDHRTRHLSHQSHVGNNGGTGTVYKESASAATAATPQTVGSRNREIRSKSGNSVISSSTSSSRSDDEQVSVLSSSSCSSSGNSKQQQHQRDQQEREEEEDKGVVVHLPLEHPLTRHQLVMQQQQHESEQRARRDHDHPSITDTVGITVGNSQPDDGRHEDRRLPRRPRFTERITGSISSISSSRQLLQSSPDPLRSDASMRDHAVAAGTVGDLDHAMSDRETSLSSQDYCTSLLSHESIASTASSSSGGNTSDSGSSSLLTIGGGGGGGGGAPDSLTGGKAFRSFRSSEEYLIAMKEDLADWLNNLYDLDMNVENFMSTLETGVILCRSVLQLTNFYALLGLARAL